MDSTTKIIELASQNNGIVTAAMISSAGISRGSLKYLADTGRLDQVCIVSQRMDEKAFAHDVLYHRENDGFDALRAERNRQIKCWATI